MRAARAIDQTWCLLQNPIGNTRVAYMVHGRVILWLSVIMIQDLYLDYGCVVS